MAENSVTSEKKGQWPDPDKFRSVLMESEPSLVDGVVDGDSWIEENVAVVFDVESTGTGDGAEPVEVAYACVHFNGSILAKGSEIFRPSVHIEYGAMAVHGIAEEDIPSEALPSSCVSFEGTGVRYFVGHNIDFDAKLVGLPGSAKRICTLALVRKLFPDLDSYSLGACVLALCGRDKREYIRNAHRATHDVDLTIELLEKIVDTTWVAKWHELWMLSEQARVPEYMPFGKHKGAPIEDVPRDYVQWLLSQPDVDPYLKKAFEQAGLV